MRKDPLIVDYYTDILCVWAWITQRRIDELTSRFVDKVEIRYRYIDLFGDAITRIQSQWAEKGLFDGFSDHVINAAAPYETAEVNEDVWRKSRPITSANAHLVLKAVEKANGKKIAIDFALRLRKAFFIEAIDISDLATLRKLIEQDKIDVEPINQAINDGTAIAALMHDYQEANEMAIKGSPSFVLNEGRQILFGNVGYRVLHANIEELLKNPEVEASWC